MAKSMYKLLNIDDSDLGLTGITRLAAITVNTVDYWLVTDYITKYFNDEYIKFDKAAIPRINEAMKKYNEERKKEVSIPDNVKDTCENMTYSIGGLRFDFGTFIEETIEHDNTRYYLGKIPGMSDNAAREATRAKLVVVNHNNIAEMLCRCKFIRDYIIRGRGAKNVIKLNVSMSHLFWCCAAYINYLWTAYTQFASIEMVGPKSTCRFNVAPNVIDIIDIKFLGEDYRGWNNSHNSDYNSGTCKVRYSTVMSTLSSTPKALSIPDCDAEMMDVIRYVLKTVSTSNWKQPPWFRHHTAHDVKEGIDKLLYNKSFWHCISRGLWYAYYADVIPQMDAKITWC